VSSLLPFIIHEISTDTRLLFLGSLSLLHSHSLIRSNFIKTTYDISLDSQISFLPLGFSPLFCQPSIGSLIRRGWRWRELCLEGESLILGHKGKSEPTSGSNIYSHKSQADTKNLTSSSKFSGSCVLT